MNLTNRCFIVAPETGAVVVFIKWPTGVPDSHLFRIEKGKLHFVHSLTVCTVPNCAFPAGPQTHKAKEIENRARYMRLHWTRNHAELQTIARECGRESRAI